MNQKYVNLFSYIALVILFGCSELDSDALSTCRDTYKSILVKRDSILLPRLNSIQEVEEYISFIEKYYKFVQETDERFRKCMKESHLVASKEETSKWIQTAVRLGSIEYKWNKIIKNPDQFRSEAREVDIHLEHTINVDIETIKNFID